MQVVDTARSERGQQRRKTSDGKLLHCCCICGRLEAWRKDWTAHYSIKDLDDGNPIPKFCSDACKRKGGHRASAVTVEMKQTARNAELREPNIVYREATDEEKYRAAAGQQRREKDRVGR